MPGARRASGSPSHRAKSLSFPGIYLLFPPWQSLQICGHPCCPRASSGSLGSPCGGVCGAQGAVPPSCPPLALLSPESFLTKPFGAPQCSPTVVFPRAMCCVYQELVSFIIVLPGQQKSRDLSSTINLFFFFPLFFPPLIYYYSSFFPFDVNPLLPVTYRYVHHNLAGVLGSFISGMTRLLQIANNIKHLHKY